MPSHPSSQIETFSNPDPDHDYTIRMRISEFTCLCPRTGQPDFATLLLEYVPDRLCLELKSLKLYIWSFRDRGAFHEAVTPRFMRLTARFNVRGGIRTRIIAERRAAHWRAAEAVVLP
jgi:7-cyano-7-deazaguanine reductase